ncbi:hypothetical protein [Micromonospora musae]|nr:hypothetical protein [Micromonospora musae]
MELSPAGLGGRPNLAPFRRWPAMLAVVAVVTAGCASPSSPLPEEQDMPGVWCGSEQEILTLKADDTFEITRLSKTHLDELLGDPNYVDGYRIRMEFDGVAPTSGSGTWSFRVTTQGWPFLDLSYHSLDGKKSSDVLELGVDHDEEKPALVIYDGNRDNSWLSWFHKCDMPAPTGSPAG